MIARCERIENTYRDSSVRSTGPRMSMSMPKPPILGLFCYGSVMTCSSEAVSSNLKDLHLISFARARTRAGGLACNLLQNLRRVDRLLRTRSQAGRGFAAGGPQSHNSCAKICCRFLADAANGFQPSPIVGCRRAAQGVEIRGRRRGDRMTSLRPYARTRPPLAGRLPPPQAGEGWGGGLPTRDRMRLTR